MKLIIKGVDPDGYFWTECIHAETVEEARTKINAFPQNEIVLISKGGPHMVEYLDNGHWYKFCRVANPSVAQTLNQKFPGRFRLGRS